jgi:hypothetical protein
VFLVAFGQWALPIHLKYVLRKHRDDKETIKLREEMTNLDPGGQLRFSLSFQESQDVLCHNSCFAQVQIPAFTLSTAVSLGESICFPPALQFLYL